MGSSIPNILQFPLELFRAILAEALLVRGIKRALRLRLVNRFFAIEVHRLIIEEQLILHTLDSNMNATGTWGAEYMAHRLLYTGLPVTARWGIVRHIAARLARDDEDSSKTYPLYVQKLCVRAAEGIGPSLAACCTAGPGLGHPSTDLCGGLYCDYDLVAAAAYLNKTLVIDQIANNKHTLRVALGRFGDPFICAVLGDNHEAMQLLFEKVALVAGEGAANTLRYRIMSRVSARGSTAIVQASLPKFTHERYQDVGENQRSPEMKMLDTSLRTTNVETFDILMQIKKTTPHPEVEEEHWQELLKYACMNGSADMIQRLLTLDTSHHSYRLADMVQMDPIKHVCLHCEKLDSDHIVRILLSYGAPVTSDAITGAAKFGKLSLVQVLVEAGANVNSGGPKPLVSAIALERTDMLKALIRWGARLNSEVMEACASRAREESLESMLNLLKKYRTK